MAYSNHSGACHGKGAGGHGTPMGHGNKPQGGNGGPTAAPKASTVKYGAPGGSGSPGRKTWPKNVA